MQGFNFFSYIIIFIFIVCIKNIFLNYLNIPDTYTDYLLKLYVFKVKLKMIIIINSFLNLICIVQIK